MLVVLDGDGADVTGLDAVKYVAAMGDAGVYPRPSEGVVPADVAVVDKWLAFDAASLAPPVASVTAALAAKGAFDKLAYDAAMKDLEGALKTLNDHLAVRGRGPSVHTPNPKP